MVSVTDAKKQSTQFEYNANQDLTGLTDPKGSNFKYEYDGKHNVTKSTSAENNIGVFTYDEKGNIIKSGAVSASDHTTGLWTERTFTSDQNHVASVTDAGGRTASYTWDLTKDQLTRATDAKGTQTEYTYDPLGRLSRVSMGIEDGAAAEVGYTYTLDKLTAIAHNGFSYGFAYDPYGNIKTVSVAGTNLITHNYEAGNGNLMSNVYGNGDTVRYVYDEQDRVSEVYTKTASGTEKQLFSYIYNKEGYLYQVTDHVLGRSAVFAYDLLGRLAQVDNSDGSWYRYIQICEKHICICLRRMAGVRR